MHRRNRSAGHTIKVVIFFFKIISEGKKILKPNFLSYILSWKKSTYSKPSPAKLESIDLSYILFLKDCFLCLCLIP